MDRAHMVQAMGIPLPVSVCASVWCYRHHCLHHHDIGNAIVMITTIIT
jgi:hypothetical protein